jgi:pilus assembly protein CpaE
VYPFTAALMIADQDLREQALIALHQMPARVLFGHTESEDPKSFLHKFGDHKPDVVLLDAKLISGPMEPFLKMVRDLPAKPVIIALNQSAEPDLILLAMRAGAGEFLFPPFNEALRDAIERRIDEQRRSRESVGRQGRVVAFLSAKGGCGATTVVCHVAAELQRQSNFNILLADMDMHCGMVHFLMKAKSPHTLQDAFNNLHRLDAHYWRALVSNGTPRLEIISAPDPINLHEMPKPEHLRQVLSFVRTQYDWSLLDLGSHLNNLKLSILDDVDETCLLTTLELPALHRAKQIMQKLLDSGYGRNRLRLVLNRVPPRMDVTPIEIEKMFGWPVYALLPEDHQALHEAYSEGKLLPPSAGLSKNVARLTRKLTGMSEPKQKTLFRLFG